MRLWLKMKILATYQSQNKFALAIKKSPSWLSQIIRGRVNPTAKEKELIANALSVEDIESLFIEQKTQSN